jgi:hypothetical protein
MGPPLLFLKDKKPGVNAGLFVFLSFFILPEWEKFRANFRVA